MEKVLNIRLEEFPTDLLRLDGTLTRKLNGYFYNEQLFWNDWEIYQIFRKTVCHSNEPYAIGVCIANNVYYATYRNNEYGDAISIEIFDDFKTAIETAKKMYRLYYPREVETCNNSQNENGQAIDNFLKTLRR